jgi:hypothetical protein
MAAKKKKQPLAERNKINVTAPPPRSSAPVAPARKAAFRPPSLPEPPPRFADTTGEEAIAQEVLKAKFRRKRRGQSFQDDIFARS